MAVLVDGMYGAAPWWWWPSGVVDDGREAREIEKAKQGNGDAAYACVSGVAKNAEKKALLYNFNSYTSLGCITKFWATFVYLSWLYLI